MPETIRWHLDEHVSPAVADALRRNGMDVTTPADVGMFAASDIAHLEFALREQRVIFTQDHDFLILHSRGEQHAGIVYCRQATRTIGEIIAALSLIWAVYEPNEMSRRVEYV